MLSAPVIARMTGAVVVLVYRHPGAVLASYRRMGWSPDLAEVRPWLTDRVADSVSQLQGAAREAAPKFDEPEAMGMFWSALYGRALADVGQVPRMLVVSHDEVARGGAAAARMLFDALGLRWSDSSSSALQTTEGGTPRTSTVQQLHNFDRAPSEVARAWRSRLDPAEIKDIEATTSDVRRRMHDARFPLVTQ